MLSVCIFVFCVVCCQNSICVRIFPYLVRVFPWGWCGPPPLIKVHCRFNCGPCSVPVKVDVWCVGCCNATPMYNHGEGGSVGKAVVKNRHGNDRLSLTAHCNNLTLMPLEWQCTSHLLHCKWDLTFVGWCAALSRTPLLQGASAYPSDSSFLCILTSHIQACLSIEQVQRFKPLWENRQHVIVVACAGGEMWNNG